MEMVKNAGMHLIGFLFSLVFLFVFWNIPPKLQTKRAVFFMAVTTDKSVFTISSIFIVILTSSLHSHSGVHHTTLTFQLLLNSKNT